MVTSPNVRNQHYTRNTVSATRYCRKCEKSTYHRVDNGHLGPCMDCISRLDAAHADAAKTLCRYCLQQITSTFFYNCPKNGKTAGPCEPMIAAEVQEVLFK